MIERLFTLKSERQSMANKPKVVDRRVDVIGALKQAITLATQPMAEIKTEQQLRLQRPAADEKEALKQSFRVMNKLLARAGQTNDSFNSLDSRGQAVVDGWPTDELVATEVEATTDLVAEMGATPSAVRIGHELLDITIQRLDR